MYLYKVMLFVFVLTLSGALFWSARRVWGKKKQISHFVGRWILLEFLDGVIFYCCLLLITLLGTVWSVGGRCPQPDANPSWRQHSPDANNDISFVMQHCKHRILRVQLCDNQMLKQGAFHVVKLPMDEPNLHVHEKHLP